MNKIAKLSLILLGLLFLFFAKVSPAYACSCRRPFGPEPLKILKAFRDADAVFVGRVIDTKLESDKDKYEFTVDISNPYKYSGGLTRIKIFTNDPNGTTCGYPARKSREYLVYAGETQDGDWTTNICTRTDELEMSTKDVAFLNRFEDFNNTAFKVYKQLGWLTLLPILHQPEPELFGPVDMESSVRFEEDRIYVTPIWGEGIIRNPLWFEGWKVFANLFIWIVAIVIVILILRRKFFLKRKWVGDLPKM